MESNLNKCPYCGKQFARERTLHVHMCEPKRRHMQKNEKKSGVFVCEECESKGSHYSIVALVFNSEIFR